MYKKWGIIFALFTNAAISSTVLSVKDNSDFALTLSQTNYNRLVIRGDEIVEAVFPPNAMAIKTNAEDGSVYLMLQATNPFTLFLATKAGRHFSATINAEDSLGKTIELIPVETKALSINANTNSVKITDKPSSKEIVPEAILAMLNHMESHKPFADVNIKHQFGKALRYSQGLTLLPKELWDGKLLQGEKIELYNGSKKTLELSQEWFAKEGTLALKLSKPTLNPGEKAFLYRVQEVYNG